ncbi:MAG: tRNA 5-hydroxyuridine modification protein YegQ [Hahellaceae bacterium]|nr:tRNA 5-hydroxyuridine modification protein YegQ [Hahellaceae bacterium]
MTTELLAPAGTLKSMRYAFAYGADAVYAGQPRYSLRVRNNEFNRLDVLAEACREAHDQGKQFYLASNLSPHNNKVRTYLKDLEPVIAMKPDALIMSDPGLIMMVRETWPDQVVHLSVQANAVNYATVKFWQRQGISRVILSRELSLDEIEEIRQECPEMELEVFVHGALCIAYSGRCLLSGYMTHRDSNQGACTNSCRWQYNVHEARENVTGELIPTLDAAHAGGVSGVFDPAHASPKAPETHDEIAVLLQEKTRPGEYMPAYEDEHGTYIMNSKDLRAVQHVERLVKMGIHSLKIEGRTKSHYYVGRTVQVYRKAIDDALAGRPFNMNLMAELEHLANRGYTEGFYRRHVPSEYQNYEDGTSVNLNQQFVGEGLGYDAKSGWLTVEVKNRFVTGEQMEIITPKGNLNFKLDAIENLKGQTVDVAPGDGHTVRIPLPSGLSIPEDGAYTLVMSHRQS